MALIKPTVILAIIGGFSILAHADTAPIDPEIALDAGHFSDPISDGSTFAPDANGGGITGFYNPFSSNLTELQFQATVDKGLQQPGTFTCQVLVYFLNCGINYDSSSGLLTVTFSGTTPLNGPPSPFEGIPTLP